MKTLEEWKAELFLIFKDHQQSFPNQTLAGALIALINQVQQNTRVIETLVASNVRSLGL